MNHRPGFTLIELLVVVAIISILASILLPTLSNAKAKGKQAICAGNLRQIHLAFTLYADDYSSSFPWTQYWYDYLGAYLGGVESTTATGPRRSVLKCPGENRSRASSWPAGTTLTMYENQWMRSSYMMSYSINHGNYNPSIGKPRQGFGGATDNAGGVAAAPFVTDCQVYGWGGDVPQYDWNMGSPAWVATYWIPYYVHIYRHPGTRASMLYLDGHVEAIRSIVESSTPTFVWIYSNPP